MKLRCVVVDDERPARERVKRLLSTHADIECVGEAAHADGAVALIDERKPDLCFLDIEMPEGDGFGVLQRVKHRPAVIFCTAYNEYAVKAFEVHSLDYLLKPFGKLRFEEALTRARGALDRGRESHSLATLIDELRREISGGGSRPLDRISARRGSKILLLDPRQVLWFEAEDTLVFARTDDGRSLVERTLADLEGEFGGEFFRAHRSCLVNLNKIAEIVPGEAGTHRIVFGDPLRSSVPLSRRQARRLRELIPW